jgi:hypothetical protein
MPADARIKLRLKIAMMVDNKDEEEIVRFLEVQHE